MNKLRLKNLRTRVRKTQASMGFRDLVSEKISHIESTSTEIDNQFDIMD